MLGVLMCEVSTLASLMSDAFLWLVHLWLLVLVGQNVIFSCSLVIILSEGHH